MRVLATSQVADHYHENSYNKLDRNPGLYLPIRKGGDSCMPDKPGLLSLYSDVQTKTVSWLWFPYIAYGKLTVLQGDPGDGKSSMMLHLIAEISRGGADQDSGCRRRRFRL